MQLSRSSHRTVAVVVRPRRFEPFRAPISPIMFNWLLATCVAYYYGVLFATALPQLTKVSSSSLVSPISETVEHTAKFEEPENQHYSHSLQASDKLLEPATTVDEPATSTITPIMLENSSHYHLDWELLNTRVIQVLGLLSFCLILPTISDTVLPWLQKIAKSFLLKLSAAASITSFLIAVLYALRTPAKLILYKHIPAVFNRTVQTSADVLVLPLLVLAASVFLTFCLHVLIYRHYLISQAKKLVKSVGIIRERLFKGRLISGTSAPEDSLTLVADALTQAINGIEEKMKHNDNRDPEVYAMRVLPRKNISEFVGAVMKVLRTQEPDIEIFNQRFNNPHYCAALIKACVDPESTLPPPPSEQEDPWDDRLLIAAMMAVNEETNLESIDPILIPEVAIVGSAADIQAERDAYRTALNNPNWNPQTFVNEVNTQRRAQRKKEREEKPFSPEFFKKNGKTINGLRRYLQDTSGREKIWAEQGVVDVPPEWYGLLPSELARKVAQWRDEIWIRHMKTKGVELIRCDKCRMVVRKEGHECIKSEGKKEIYIGGVPYKEVMEVGISGTKILHRVTKKPDLAKMEENMKKTKESWTTKTAIPAPLPENILTPVMRISPFQPPQIPANMPELSYEERLELYQMARRLADPNITEEEMHARTERWKLNNAPRDVEMANTQPVVQIRSEEGDEVLDVTGEAHASTVTISPFLREPLQQNDPTAAVLICNEGEEPMQVLQQVLSGQRPLVARERKPK